MKHSCITCDYATILTKNGKPIKEKEEVITGYYCAITRLKFLFDVAHKDCPAWDKASPKRYPE